jgi:hypothetical protein
MVKVKLLRPLDGKAEGETAEYPEADAKRLDARGVVQIIGTKADPAPANKARPAAPSNKSKKGS